MFEKADQVGGTSAWSGGMLWTPCHRHMAELGIDDDRPDVLTYMAAISHGLDGPLAEAYVDRGPEMIELLEANSPAGFSIVEGFPDYHPEHPGAKPHGGQAVKTPLFPYDELGAWAELVTIGPQMGRNIKMSETPLGHGAPDGVPEEEMERRRVHDERGAGRD